MNNKLIIFLLMIAAVFGYTVYEAMKLDKKLGESSFSQTSTVLKSLPANLKFKTFPDDKDISLSEMTAKGDKLFVHFWATWCGPCEVEFPELVEMMHLLKDKKDIKFLLVAVNDDVVKVTKFLKKFKLEQENILVLVDNNNDFQNFGTYKLPETYVFGSDNSVVKRFPGQQPWTQKYLVDFLLKL